MPLGIYEHKRKPIADRLWPKVNKNGPVPTIKPELGPCWIWLGSKNEKGYGRISAGGRGLSPRKAHAVAYELLRGPIPKGKELDHLCRNRACVNPAHLEPVTGLENWKRGVSVTALNYRKTHCKNGHPFSGKNLYLYADGGRACVRCRILGLRRFRERKRQRAEQGRQSQKK